MLSLRAPRMWLGLGWLLVGGIGIASLLPAQWVPTFSLRDKVLHAGSYCLLMVWFAGIYRREHHATIALLLLVFGLALDLAQLTTSTRSFEWADVAANASGILAGLFLARFILEGWCCRVERLLGLS